jgi:hypothetical protein
MFFSISLPVIDQYALELAVDEARHMILPPLSITVFSRS